MLQQRQCLQIAARATRRRVLSSPKIREVIWEYRLLSSARPLIQEQEDVDDWKESNKALKRVIQQSPTMVKASNDLITKKVSVGLTSHEVHDHDEQVDADSSPSHLTYTGNVTMPITTHLHIVTPGEDAPRGVWPVFRLLVSDVFAVPPSGALIFM